MARARSKVRKPWGSGRRPWRRSAVPRGPNDILDGALNADVVGWNRRAYGSATPRPSDAGSRPDRAVLRDPVARLLARRFTCGMTPVARMSVARCAPRQPSSSRSTSSTSKGSRSIARSPPRGALIRPSPATSMSTPSSNAEPHLTLPPPRQGICRPRTVRPDAEGRQPRGSHAAWCRPVTQARPCRNHTDASQPFRSTDSPLSAGGMLWPRAPWREAASRRRGEEPPPSRGGQTVRTTVRTGACHTGVPRHGSRA